MTVITQTFRPEVEVVFERCGSLDASAPRHDPARAIAAYERRLAAAGLSRNVRWIADPIDAETWDITFARAVKAWRAAVAPPLRDPFNATVPDWSAFRESPYPWNHGGSSASIKALWQAAVGWAASGDDEPDAIRVAADWDRTTAERAASLACDNLEAMLLRNPFNWHWVIPNPMFPVTAKVTLPLPLIPAVQAARFAYTLAWAGPAHWSRCALGAIWDSTTAWDAGLAVRWLNLPDRSKAVEALIDLYIPMIDAFEAGAFAHCLLDDDLIVLAAPAITPDGDSPCRCGRVRLEWPRTKALSTALPLRRRDG